MNIKPIGEAVNKLRLKTEPQPIYTRVLKIIRYHLPVILVIAVAEIIVKSRGYESNFNSLIPLFFLAAIVYLALKRGVLISLTGTAILMAYDIISRFSTIETYSLDDEVLRRLVILSLALPLIAYVVGRLKEKNDHLLQYEKRARLKAEESENRLRFMAESMPQKVFTSKPDGTSDYFNPQWSEYTGMSFRQLKRGDWTKVIHPDDVEDNLNRWQYSLKTGEPFAFEHRLKRHDGAYRWHVARAQAMRNEEGKITKWVGSDTDIHDIKLSLRREHKLEVRTAALAEQREQLVLLNKAKDEFISLSSHQLRTPSTGVKQYLAMVLEGYAGQITEEQRTFLKQAYDSNERQLVIINDLLRVAQVDAGKVTLRRTEVDIIPLLRDVIDEQSSKFSARNQTLLFQPKNPRLKAKIDTANIRMVLENIIDNASKYTPPNKTIEISAKKLKDECIITIKDEGVGIEKNDISRIFSKFSRIENPLSAIVGGSGLGLYWVKKIIDLHEGSIDVNSEIGKGTTFTIRLPL